MHDVKLKTYFWKINYEINNFVWSSLEIDVKTFILFTFFAIVILFWKEPSPFVFA